MPISWLPVISDYTKDAEKPVQATAVSAVAYSLASLWMYFIGIEIAGIGASNNIAQAILLAGLGIPGIVIVVLSTVTTNFLAANSAGESAKAIYGKLNPKVAGVVVSVLSAVLAISGIMDHYISFLYLIASVFAPMAAVLLVSFFFAKGRSESLGAWLWNFLAWLAGFAVYQVAGRLDSVFLGPTLIAVIVSAALAYARVFKFLFLNGHATEKDSAHQ
jgi:purine-cytosine permease-like protein